jgi:hypothetical protein
VKCAILTNKSGSMQQENVKTTEKSRKKNIISVKYYQISDYFVFCGVVCGVFCGVVLQVVQSVTNTQLL